MQKLDKVELVFYSNLLRETEIITKDIFDFLKLDFTSQTQQLVAQSIQKEVVDTCSVFKQKQENDNSYLKYIPAWLSEEVIRDCKKVGLGKFLI